MPRIIEFVVDLPKTISGKVRGIELRAKEVENPGDRMLIDLEFFHEKYRRTSKYIIFI